MTNRHELASSQRLRGLGVILVDSHALILQLWWDNLLLTKYRHRRLRLSQVRVKILAVEAG